MVLFMVITGAVEAAPHRIILIGGAKSEGPTRHDYPNGIRRIQQLLESTPDANGGRSLVVAAYPDGWPTDPTAFDGASTIVWYFDGLYKHPLHDAARRLQFESLMKRGVGLVALHQSSTVPAGENRMRVQHWLGAVREGLFDRTDEMVALKAVTPVHPVSRGVEAFTYFDEFYPTLHFYPGGRRVTPILQGRLHVQARDGKAVVIGAPRVHTVAWAFEREGGGRSFGYSGAHYLAALDEPSVQKMLLNAIFWTADIEVPQSGVRAADNISRATHSSIKPGQQSSHDVTTFHRDPQRTGWNPLERDLTPASVATPAFGSLWSSPQFDSTDGHPPRMHASPLYLDQVKLSSGEYRGGTFSVIFAATSNGYVYAVNAFGRDGVVPGTILWRTRLAAPCLLQPVLLDGIATGVLSTPVIDVRKQRLYVTSCDPEKRWQAYALDIASGEVLPGWPVQLDEATFNAVNRNPGSGAPVAPKKFDYRVQRGALNLSPGGGHLYVTFGESSTGWIVAVDTAAIRITSAFASVADPHRGTGGIWGSGGPAVDADGGVFVVTGTGFNGYLDRARNWAQSVIKLEHVPSSSPGFNLRGTYTPFNHCDTATMDIDLGSGGALLLPDLSSTGTATPQLLAVGGKQGNVYLLDRARMPGHLERRQPCSTDAATDRSLLAPDIQPQFGTRGPLNVFGPYSEKDAAIDTARSRSVPAYFRDGHGGSYLFVTGTSRRQPATSTGMQPSLVRLKVVVTPQIPAYLKIDQLEQTQIFENPGSPVVSSDGGRDAVVWVLDSNARRSAPLVGEDAPRPVLYALDALTFKLLWKSRQGELPTSGKYNEPLIARGAVFVGTDRIQAFGLRDDGAVKITAGDTRALYKQRCATCHELPEGRIPPRELIATRSHAYIVDVLTHGVMRVQAVGLNISQIDSLATYLKQFTP